MIRTVGQPIVNIITGQKVLEERLCRPSIPLKEYFSYKDRNTLLRRELHSIFQSIEDANGYPCNINVTVYSLLTLVHLPIVWNGGIELVEWDREACPSVAELREAVRAIQSKGLTVWADDVTPQALAMWLEVGVNGIKTEIQLIKDDRFFLDKLKGIKKPTIIEKVETEEEDAFLKENGFQLAQGFYYGMPGETKENVVNYPTPKGGGLK